MRWIALFLCFTWAPLACAEENAEPIDWIELNPHWVAPMEPFHILGNIYYVGTEGLAVYLITGENGHALIDGGMPGYEQLIIDNIATLGFDINDVKYLFNTHAHFDHSGGLAALKEASGGELYASVGDVSALEGGFYLGFEDNADYAAPPVKVDHVLKDRDPEFEGAIVSFSASGEGKPLLKTELTPGHSRGCTSFRIFFDENNNEHHEALIFCSATVAANRLVATEAGAPQYEGIVDDYRMTFEKTRFWTPDVFLANHAETFHMKEKRAAQLAGNPRAFLNRGAFQRYMAAKRGAFERELAEQTAAAKN